MNATREAGQRKKCNNRANSDPPHNMIPTSLLLENCVVAVFLGLPSNQFDEVD